jgi:hypothetical protein
MAFSIYGDESTAGDTTVYGAVFVPNSQIHRAEAILHQTKRQYSVPEDAELHCCNLFHGDHRKKSLWSHLSEEQTYAFGESLLTRLNALPCIYSVGAVHRSEYPRELPAGAGFPAGHFETKQLTALAFQAAVVPLIQNLERSTVHLYADPDPGRIRWFGKKIKADSNYRIAAGNGVGEVEIVPQQNEDITPSLLQVADLFAYAAGRALSSDSCRAKSRYESMYRICRPLLSVMHAPEKRSANELTGSILDARHKSVIAPQGTRPLLFETPPGACYWTIGVNRQGACYPCLVLRLPNGAAGHLLSSPCNIDVRFGQFNVGQYKLVVLMARLPNIPLTFTTFLNEFAHKDESPIARLARGEELRLVPIEGESRPEGEIPIPNRSPQYWAQIEIALNAIPPYHADAHIAALRACTLSPDDMWNACGG